MTSSPNQFPELNIIATPPISPSRELKSMMSMKLSMGLSAVSAVVFPGYTHLLFFHELHDIEMIHCFTCQQVNEKL